MTTDDKLQELFERELQQPLAETASIRQKMHKNSLLAIPFAVMVALMFLVPILWLRITGIVVFLLVAIYQLAVSQHYYSKLVPFYRNTLMAKLVELVNPNYIYSTKEWFDVNLFNDSELYSTKATRCQEGLMIVGEVEKMPFYFAEVHAEYMQENDEGKETYPTLFYGLMFVADFNKHLQGRTFVVPDKDLKEPYKLLELGEMLIKEMNLNTRIWTKK